MPGYDDQVYHGCRRVRAGRPLSFPPMPMREPYVCYMQGGLTYESGKLGIFACCR